LSDPGTCGDPSLAGLRHALEKVAAQRDAHAAHLYWYTDFAAARAAAEAQGKPILSLRLLGKLDEEFSCANSRFFRTALYANTEVSAYLRQNFVLHWQSVRPVPRLTIDFGDGRVVERTITGNSIHYILTPGGEVVDALPGLYSPRAFRTALQPAAELARAVAARPAAERAARLAGWHRVSAAALAQQWDVDTGFSQQQAAAPVQTITLQMAGGQPPLAATDSSQQGAVPVARPVTLQLAAAPAPTAEAASSRASSKSAVERPVIRRSTRPRGAAVTPQTEEERLARLAEILRLQVRMDAGSTALLRAKHTTRESMDGVIDRFEQAMPKTPRGMNMCCIASSTNGSPRRRAAGGRCAECPRLRRAFPDARQRSVAGPRARADLQRARRRWPPGQVGAGLTPAPRSESSRPGVAREAAAGRH
jgi:hypothetical protein